MRRVRFNSYNKVRTFDGQSYSWQVVKESRENLRHTPDATTITKKTVNTPEAITKKTVNNKPVAKSKLKTSPRRKNVKVAV